MSERPAKTLPLAQDRPGVIRATQEVLRDVHGAARPHVAFEKTPVRIVHDGDGVSWKLAEFRA